MAAWAFYKEKDTKLKLRVTAQILGVTFENSGKSADKTKDAQATQSKEVRSDPPL